MKNLKKLFFAVAVIFVVACNSSDDDDDPNKIAISGAINVTSLSTLVGNDATSLITLNGQPAATQTTEASIGDEISYQISTGTSTVEVVILDFFFTSGNREFWVNNVEVSVNSQVTPSIASLKILGGTVGDEAKFGFTFALKTNGVVDMNTTYIVDPKIKIRSRG